MALFTLDQARALLHDVRTRADTLITVRADIAEIATALERGRPAPGLGGLPELKALEARFHEIISWYTEQGIEIKGVAPLLLDFPATRQGQDVLLCWLEGETELGWYHLPEHGFMGRRTL